jgi:hypothetical protein
MDDELTQRDGEIPKADLEAVVDDLLRHIRVELVALKELVVELEKHVGHCISEVSNARTLHKVSMRPEAETESDPPTELIELE